MRFGPVSLVCLRGDLAPTRIPDGVELAAEATWRLTGPADAVAEVMTALGDVSESITSGVALISFGNSIGFFRAPHLGLVEARSAKMPRRQFYRMLEELTAIAAALPFSSHGPSALPYDRSVPLARDLLYHAMVYLRHVVLEVRGDTNLATAYEIVLADPHQRLVRDERPVAPEMARSVGPRALERLVAGGVRLNRAPQWCRAPVAVALRGHLPERVFEEVASRFVDTAENRFAKAFLDQVIELTREAERRLTGRSTTGAGRIAADCRAIRDRLEPIARRRFWKGIGPLVTLPESSTVMQRRRGYRELFEHFAKLRLASRVPLSPRDASRLLELKDVATLYELWCYFKVVEAVRGVAGPPAAAEVVKYTDLDAQIRHGYLVTWADGTTVAYNPSFRRGHVRRRSYSVTLRPDISLRVPPGRPNSGLHLLDAKFKVSNLSELLATDLDDDDEARDHSSFKRADLYKMHTYRDAIVGTRTVWVLYPGEECSFYDVESREPLGDLQRMRGGAEGVGAVALRPESDGGESLGGLVRGLLRGGI